MSGMEKAPKTERAGIEREFKRGALELAVLHLLQSGVALEIVALWLGHASPITTHGYVVADLKMKQECLEQLDQHDVSPRPSPEKSRILGFLEAV